MVSRFPILRIALISAVILLLGIQVSGAFSSSPAFKPVSNNPKLAPKQVHPQTAKAVVARLKSHYRKIDDESALSSLFLEQYIRNLDPNRIYFLSKDISNIDQYRDVVYEQVKSGNLDAGYDIFNLYQERVNERLDYLLTKLEEGLPPNTFTAKDDLLVDRSEADWIKSTESMNRLWDKRLAHAIVSMRLDDVEDDEIQKRLIRRYKGQKKRNSQSDAEDVFQFYMNALAEVYDPHTAYFTPHVSENFNINMSRSLEGIGAVLQGDDEYTKIQSLVPGGPAAKGGQLKVADRIVGVGQENKEIVNVIGWRLNEVVELIRGPKGTKVRLEVIPAGSASEHNTRIVVIERNKVVLEEQAAKKHFITVPATKNQPEKRFAIITLPAFYIDFDAYHKGDPNYTSTTRDVAMLLHELSIDKKGVDGLIMDLRNNGGGSLYEANQLVSLFIPNSPVVQVRDARNRIKIERGQNLGISYDGPMVVLVNRFSASASEIFAGAMQDYGRALVLGDDTFGKGTVQTLLPLNHGQLKLTQAKFYRVSGSSNQNKGIIPDIPFPFLVDKNDIGESALSNALPWDRIKSSSYTPLQDISELVPALNEKHQARIKDNPEFVYVLKKMDLLKEQRNQTHVSLVEEVRKKEWAELNQRRLEIENNKRIALGEKPLSDIKALNEKEEQDEAEMISSVEDKDPNEDAYLVESAYVLADFITASLNKKSLANKAE
ncbi:MAG TPA: carboxy terminal-processing peptidase [Alcanivoracaceae bacterium]|nr:carboxy terminal-processing peptidase [Alcanivoracaceae bacterium]